MTSFMLLIVTMNVFEMLYDSIYREKIQIELHLQDFRSTHVLEEELAEERSSVSRIDPIEIYGGEGKDSTVCYRTIHAVLYI